MIVVKSQNCLRKSISFIYTLSYIYKANKNVLSGRILEGTTTKIREKITCRKRVFYYWLRNAAHPPPRGLALLKMSMYFSLLKSTVLHLQPLDWGTVSLPKGCILEVLVRVYRHEIRSSISFVRQRNVLSAKKSHFYVGHSNIRCNP